jgi:hypothetical protein
MLKGIKDLLQCEDPFGRFLLYFPNVTVCSRSDLLEDVEPPEDVAFNKSGVVLRHKLNIRSIIAS